MAQHRCQDSHVPKTKRERMGSEEALPARLSLGLSDRQAQARMADTRREASWQTGPRHALSMVQTNTGYSEANAG